MTIKYGNCTNPGCPLRSKIQDAEDSCFVCQNCQTKLSESSGIVDRPSNKNIPLLIVGAVLSFALLCGIVYFWIQKSAPIPKLPSIQGTLTKSESNNTEKKSLEEWLHDYSIDRQIQSFN